MVVPIGLRSAIQTHRPTSATIVEEKQGKKGVSVQAFNTGTEGASPSPAGGCGEEGKAVDQGTVQGGRPFSNVKIGGILANENAGRQTRYPRR